MLMKRWTERGWNEKLRVRKGPQSSTLEDKKES
jgi:hypothetical protein